jgi:hypothetical protein
VLFVPEVAVGAVGVPVKAGEAIGAYKPLRLTQEGFVAPLDCRKYPEVPGEPLIWNCPVKFKLTTGKVCPKAKDEIPSKIVNNSFLIPELQLR